MLLSVGCVVFQLLHCGGCRGCDCAGGGYPAGVRAVALCMLCYRSETEQPCQDWGSDRRNTSGDFPWHLSLESVLGICPEDWLSWLVISRGCCLAPVIRLPRSSISTRPLRESNLETPLGNHILRYRRIRTRYSLTPAADGS